MTNVVVNINELDQTKKEELDAFILDEKTNGEFINSLNYLSYHPEGRFDNDSIVIMDDSNKNIVGAMFANVLEGGRCVSSYSGTTFSGPIVNIKNGIQKNMELIDMMLNYYESKYDKVVIKPIPEIFSRYPSGVIFYSLLRRGYVQYMSALSNVIDISHISNFDDVLQTADSKRRNQIKKVIKENIFELKRIEHVTKEIWDSINSNLKQKYNTYTVHTLEEINDLINRCQDNIEVHAAFTRDGVYGALAIIYKFKKVFHTQYLDLNYEFAKYNPNLLLVSKMMERAAREGYKLFSFGASTEREVETVNASLFEYKAGYGIGSVILPMFTWKRIKS